MSAAHHRLSRPVYESLPWAYMGAGGLGLLTSYLETEASPALSLGLGLPGLCGVLAGGVILLRRRSYRRLRAQYGSPDGLDEAIGPSAARSSPPGSPR